MTPSHHYAMWAGWKAGLRGADPRECPYDKMTVEWREWQSWHRYAVEMSLWYDDWSENKTP